MQQARAWRESLPQPFQEEIDGLVRGARAPIEAVDLYLYADIAKPAGAGADGPGPRDPDATITADGPMCSGIAVEINGLPWVARNCDWYRRLLVRGTAAVVHRVPGRHPVMALGIFGDIDCDTGVNAVGLWVHVHTLHATDRAPESRRQISWLFWCREALETCGSIEELERFVALTARDRGIIVFAAEGKTGRRAIFECGVATHERVDAQAPGHALFACNHRSAKHPVDADRLARSRRASTTRRHERLRTLLDGGEQHGPLHPEHGPDDLIELLADPEVEMTTPPELRTIYAAVCEPRTGETWFSSGHPDGTPAASGGSWQRVPWPF